MSDKDYDGQTPNGVENPAPGWNEEQPRIGGVAGIAAAATDLPGPT